MAVCVRPPLDPVTVTVNDPVAVDDAVHESVDVPLVVVVLRAILVGDRVHVRPVEGETVAVGATVPVNPSRPAMVIVDGPDPLDGMATLVGLAVTVKSWTVKVTVVETVLLPLVPTTVTV